MEDKCRKFFAVMAAVLVSTSYLAVHCMAFWQTPSDYWYSWATVLTGLGGTVCIVAAVIFNVCYLSRCAETNS